MNVKFKSLSFENFKGIRNLQIDFNDLANVISGRNATGKTTVIDSIWWLFFGTDSHGNSKFEIRELDSNGDKVHHTKISVTLVAEIDGTETTLQRIQEEKWVKKRGQEEQEFSGNKDSYLINGFPKSAREYEDFIASIVDENVFQILSNPMTFPNLDWKEQRKLLLSLINISPEEVGKNVDYFDLISADILQESPDAVKKKYSLEKKELTKRQEQLPVEINTLHGQIREVDEKTLREKESSLNLDLDSVNEEIFKVSKVNNSAIESKITELKSQQKVIILAANDKRSADVREARSAVDAVQREYQIAEFSLTSEENNINRKKNGLKTKQEQVNNLLKLYKKMLEEKFPENESYCPRCGQKLPTTDLEKIKVDWEKRHKDETENAKNKGNELYLQTRELEKQIAESESSLENQKKTFENLKTRLEEVSATLKTAESQPISDGKDLPEYVELEKQIQELYGEMVDLPELQNQKFQLEQKRSEIKANISAVQQSLAQVGINQQIEADIDAKTEELKSVAQRISDAERKLFVLENYVKALSSLINSQFDGLEFKLFENQINGGIKETCSITYNGVPYSSLNSGHRITAGLQIIKTFRKLYGVELPVFIDNAECLSSDNLPEMDGQMVLLKVSDDKELTVN